MGLENLLGAIALLKNRIPDVYLVIGGDGPLKDALVRLSKERGITNNIRFDGYIPDNQLPDYYSAADAFVLPTKELEGFGLITLEALASGTPVFGTPVGGTIEILSRLDKNFLFDDTDAESICASIQHYHSDIKRNPEIVIKMTKACRSFVERNYSWETNVNSIESIFRNSI
jgi:glycosyltransferase involved in cell wall biosynthesis